MDVAEEEITESNLRKRNRFRSRPPSTDQEFQKVNNLLCGEASGTAGLHEAAFFQLDCRVRSCAKMLLDMELLTKLNAGNMVAQDAKYHRNYLMNLYNRARKMTDKGEDDKQTIA